MKTSLTFRDVEFDPDSDFDRDFETFLNSFGILPQTLQRSQNMIQVRKATANDLPIMLPLVASYWNFEGISGYSASRIAPQLERLLSEPNLGGGWIATADGAPVGYLLAVYVFSLEHVGLTAEIDELFVSPPGRDSGVGSELLRVAETEFERLGCTNVSLQLSRDNDAARRFYFRHGYGERSGYELLDKILHPGQQIVKEK